MTEQLRGADVVARPAPSDGGEGDARRSLHEVGADLERDTSIARVYDAIALSWVGARDDFVVY